MVWLFDTSVFECFFTVSFKVWFFLSDNDKEEGKELTGGGGVSDKVSLYKGDITVLEVDAIVNAGKDLPFKPSVGCCLKGAQILYYTWLPSAVKI